MQPILTYPLTETEFYLKHRALYDAKNDVEKAIGEFQEQMRTHRDGFCEECPENHGFDLAVAETQALDDWYEIASKMAELDSRGWQG